MLPSYNIRIKINAAGKTITRAELVAILVTLREIKDKQTEEMIATDSQASLHMIHKQMYELHRHTESKHKEILQVIGAPPQQSTTAKLRSSRSSLT